MRKINKAYYIVLIFAVIGIVLCHDVTYGLRIPSIFDLEKRSSVDPKQREEASSPVLKIIAEGINSYTRSDIREAVNNGDVSAIQKEAHRQVRLGATWIDIMLDFCHEANLEKIPKAMEEIVKAIEEAKIGVPIVVDSSSTDVLEAALKVAKGKVIVNSIGLNRAKIERLLPLLEKGRTGVIALAGVQVKDNPTAPKAKGSEERIKTVRNIIKALKGKVELEDIFIDPSMDITSLYESQGLNDEFEAIRDFRKEFPDTKITMGITNVSTGFGLRRMFGRTFLAMAMAAGLDAPIIDAADRKMVATQEAATLILENWEEFDNELGRNNDMIPLNADFLDRFIRQLRPEFQATGADLINRTLLPMSILKRSLENPKEDRGEALWPSIDKKDKELVVHRKMALGFIGEVSITDYYPRTEPPRTVIKFLKTPEEKGVVTTGLLEKAYDLFWEDALLEDEEEFFLSFLRRQISSSQEEIAQLAREYYEEVRRKILVTGRLTTEIARLNPSLAQYL